jgi:hypothetical protein
MYSATSPLHYQLKQQRVCWETCWLFQRPGKCNYPFRPMLQTPIYGMVNNSQEDSIYVDDVSAEKREKGLQRLARSLMP